MCNYLLYKPTLFIIEHVVIYKYFICLSYVFNLMTTLFDLNILDK